MHDLSPHYICKSLFRLGPHQAPVYALAIGASENLLFSAGGDRIVALWDLKSKSQLPFTIRTDAPVFSLFYHAHSELLFVGCSNGKLHAVNTRSHQEHKAWLLDAGGIFDLKYDAMRNRLLAAGGSGILTAIDLTSLEVLRSVPLSAGKLRRIALRNEGDYVAIADNEGPVHVLDAETYQSIETIQAHADGASAVAWHPSKPVLVTGGKDALLRCWNMLERYSLVLSLAAHQAAIYDLLFHKNMQSIVSCSRDKTVKWWNPDTFDPLKRAAYAEGGHKHSVNKLVATEEYLVSAGDDRDIVVFGV